MQLSFACRTDVGRVRTNNEDNFQALPTRGLFVVCDGMGGHNAGEVASLLATQTVCEVLDKSAPDQETFATSGGLLALLTLKKNMQTALVRANNTIFAQGRYNAEQRGMGTTCTALQLLPHHKAVLGHVGDSRLYMLRNGNILQLTSDDTFVHELVRRGALTPKQAEDHPQGNVLSRAMGIIEDVPTQSWIFDTQALDTFFLCSDGIYNYFPHPEELAELMSGPDLETNLNAIINTALERGGSDNCTGILIRIPQPSEATAATTGINATSLDRSLARWPLFAALNDLERMRVLGLCEQIVAQANEVILSPQTPIDALFLVLQGRLQIGSQEPSQHMIAEGQAYGEQGMLLAMGYSAGIKALEPTHILKLSHQAYNMLLTQDPCLGAKLMYSALKVVGGARLLGAKNAMGHPF